MPSEWWRDIPGFTGSYQVSSLGRVRSLARVIKRRNGRGLPIAPRILRTSGPRHRVHLVDRGRERTVSRAVLMAEIWPDR